MKYVYAALLLHDIGKEITEKNIMSVLDAAGSPVDETRVKALVAAISEIDVDEVLKSAPTAVAFGAPAPAEEKAPEEEKAEKEEEEEAREEEALAGLGALFQ